FVVEYLFSLDAAERAILMKGCLRRAHRAVLGAVPLTPQELNVLKGFDDAHLATGATWKYIPLRSKRDYRRLFNAQGRSLPAEAVSSDFSDEYRAALDRQAFFRRLRAKLNDYWSKPVNCGAGEWELSTQVGEKWATLNLDFGGTS